MADIVLGCLTDVPVGYGSPQIQYLVRSMARHLGLATQPLVCEPDSSAYPAAHDQFPDLAFTRVRWDNARGPFWYMDAGAGQAVFADGIRAWLRERRPSVLVLTGFNALRYFDPTAYGPGERPFLVYCALEFLSRRELDSDTAKRHEAAAGAVDLAMFTEDNRRRYYNREFSFDGVPQATLLNAPPLDAFPVQDSRRRNGRVLFQSASIQWNATYPEYLLNVGRPPIGFDVYGFVYSGPARILASRDTAQAFAVKYCGNVTNAQLARLRAQYAYSFVAWNPRSFNTLYACPNKLFESIASGVPPITAPHPQCVDVVRTYDCGIVMRDWSYDAFCEATDEAQRLLGTPRYRELVANCRRAHRTELNWERQFAKLVPLLSQAGLGTTTAAKPRRRR